MKEQVLSQVRRCRNVQAVAELVKTDAWRFVVVDMLSDKLSKNEVFMDTEFGETFLDPALATDWHYDVGLQECRDLIALCLSMYSSELQADVQEYLDKPTEFLNVTLVEQIHVVLYDQTRHAIQENSFRFTISNLVLSLCDLLYTALNTPRMLSYMYDRADSSDADVYDFDV